MGYANETYDAVDPNRVNANKYASIAKEADTQCELHRTIIVHNI